MLFVDLEDFSKAFAHLYYFEFSSLGGGLIVTAEGAGIKLPSGTSGFVPFCYLGSNPSKIPNSMVIFSYLSILHVVKIFIKVVKISVIYERQMSVC